MTNKKVELATEGLSDVRLATAENGVGEISVQSEVGDQFGNLNVGQNTNAASIVAALVCLNVGSGSGDV